MERLDTEADVHVHGNGGERIVEDAVAIEVKGAQRGTVAAAVDAVHDEALDGVGEPGGGDLDGWRPAFFIWTGELAEHDGIWACGGDGVLPILNTYATTAGHIASVRNGGGQGDARAVALGTLHRGDNIWDRHRGGDADHRDDDQDLDQGKCTHTERVRPRELTLNPRDDPCGDAQNLPTRTDTYRHVPTR